MVGWREGGCSRYVKHLELLRAVVCKIDLQILEYILYGRFYLPTGRLDALYSTRLSPTLQALVAAISDPRSKFSTDRRSRSDNVSNVMLSLQHDVGKWCTEYTWSADDGMWGVRVLHNFGKQRVSAEVSPDESSQSPGSEKRVKRVDEDEAIGGGLRGRFSAGAEFYFSAKEKSAGGEFLDLRIAVPAVNEYCHSLHRNTFHDATGCYSTIFPTTNEFLIPVIPRINTTRFAFTSHYNNSLIQPNDGTHVWRICSPSLS